MNQGQALAILAISGLEIGAIFDLAQFCEEVLIQKPYPNNSESEENRAHKKMIILIERVKEHLYRADNQMYGEHARRGSEGCKKDYQGNKIKGTPEQRAPWSKGLMLFSQKAKVMRVNPLDLIEIFGD